MHTLRTRFTRLVVAFGLVLGLVGMNIPTQAGLGREVEHGSIQGIVLQGGVAVFSLVDVIDLDTDQRVQTGCTDAGGCIG